MKKCLPFSNNKHRQAILALIVANIIWGAASPIFKLALQNIPPFTLAFLRFWGASFLLLPFVIKDLYIARKDWLKIFLVAFFGITINITFFFMGLTKAPSINAPIIASSGPIFIYLFSILMLHEKPHNKVLTGLIISLTGVLIIVLQPILIRGLDSQIIGNLFFVLATLGSVGHAIYSKEIVSVYKPITVTFWSFVIGTITFIPFFLKEVWYNNPFYALDYRGWTGLIFGIFLSSALAYYLFEWGTQKIEAQEIGLFTYIDPLIAVIIAIPLLGEKITLVFILGSLLVFFGISLAEGRLHYHPFHKLRNG